MTEAQLPHTNKTELEQWMERQRGLQAQVDDGVRIMAF